MNYNQIFQTRLDKLNPEQRAAVDQTEGPVMVVAGPGTGKTELLSMRVANILYQTDVDASNILCLTFTDAGAANMTERLSTIIGAEAYHVSVNTFHSFGGEIINRYSQYFATGEQKPASPLAVSEIIADILAKLPHDDPLGVIGLDGQPMYRRAVEKLIGDFKKSGLSFEQLRTILRDNIAFCEQAQPLLSELFADCISKKTIAAAEMLLPDLTRIATQHPQQDFASEISLAELLTNRFADAVRQAAEDNSQKPITNWKNTYISKSPDGVGVVFKDYARSQKVLRAVDIYEQYQQELTARGLFDFSDMILSVIKAIQVNPALKAELQEQYQYILVDEFQDTNDSQMALIKELTDYDDSPNLMVVGDDDQAIYRFQGADISNIQSFAKRFPNLTQINLNKNYRSHTNILDISSQLATTITERLTNVDGTPKQILPGRDKYGDYQISHHLATTTDQEFDFVADQVEQLLKAGTTPASEIAVIARGHRDLERMAQHLSARQIDVNYDRHNNALNSELIQTLLALARIVHHLNIGQTPEAERHLAAIVANPAFGFSAEDFYHISLAAQRDRRGWLEAVKSYNEHGAQLIDWLLTITQRANIQSLNATMVELMGINHNEADAEFNENLTDSADQLDNQQSNFHSPLFDYYFSPAKLADNTYRYIGFLADYRALMGGVNDFYADTDAPSLDQLLNFVDKSNLYGQQVKSVLKSGNQNSVQLMTAHSSKGLEFDTVFIINATSKAWGSESSRGGGGGRLDLPANMPFSDTGTTDDERRRLLFVAMTRAKRQLIITTHSMADDGKAMSKLEYLLDIMPTSDLPEPSSNQLIKQLETEVLGPETVPKLTQKQLLAPKLEKYHLSATDLNNYVDLEHCGPEQFLTNSLLRVPSGVVGAMLFGTAMHAVMEKIHNYARNDKHPGELPPIDGALATFHDRFNTIDLNQTDADRYTAKGEAAIAAIYSDERPLAFKPNQQPELKLSATTPDGVRITGKIDMVEFDHQSHLIHVVDYKTGKAFSSFEKPESNVRTKAHNFYHQLMFYKLLIENSREYHNWRVTDGSIVFIEPRDGQLTTVTTKFDDNEYQQFQKLVLAVWSKIMALDFAVPEIDGVKKLTQEIFEQWLVDNISQ